MTIPTIFETCRPRADVLTGAIRVAGVLLCTGEPGQWMPHAQIQAVSYAGERQDINYQSDARDQDLTSQIDV